MEVLAATNPSTVPCYSPWRYPGGKAWFVPAARDWLRETRPRHLVGLFAGGAQVELAAAIEGLVDHVTLVELDEDVAQVWQAILDDGPAVAVELRSSATPDDVTDPRLAALVRNRTAFGGILSPSAGTQRSHNGKQPRWNPGTCANRIERIWHVRDRLELVHGDAFDVLPSLPRDSAVFADPPYVEAGPRLYRHGVVDHGRLVDLLAAHHGSVVATFDDHPLIRAAADLHGLDVATVAPGLTNRQTVRHELVVGDLDWVRLQSQQLSLF